MLYAKALFLVENENPEVFEFYVVREQAVCADEKVYLPVFDAGEYLILLGGAFETVEHFHIHAERRKAPGRRFRNAVGTRWCSDT